MQNGKLNTDPLIPLINVIMLKCLMINLALGTSMRGGSGNQDSEKIEEVD